MRYFLVLLVLFCALSGEAQFYQQFGLSMGHIRSSTYRENNGERSKYLLWGFYYYPRYAFKTRKKLSWSLGSPLVLGAEPYYARGKLICDVMTVVPAMLDLNIGGGAKEESEKHIGTFIGAGMCMAYSTVRFASWDPTDSTKRKAFTWGPMMHTGLKWVRNRVSWTFRFWGQLGLEEKKFWTLGCSVAAGL